MQQQTTYRIDDSNWYSKSTDKSAAVARAVHVLGLADDCSSGAAHSITGMYQQHNSGPLSLILVALPSTWRQASSILLKTAGVYR